MADGPLTDGQLLLRVLVALVLAGLAITTSLLGWVGLSPVFVGMFIGWCALVAVRLMVDRER